MTTWTRIVNAGSRWAAAGVVLSLAPWVSSCRDDAPADIIQSQNTTDALVFVKTTTEETLNRTWADGNLYTLSPISPDGVVAPLTNFTGASVSDPCVSFDGKRVLFSMRAPGESNRNIWEINADGSGLRRVTDDGGHDFDPLYLPDDRILFTSSRDGEMDEYNHSPAEHLYVCNADGSELHRVSFNQSDDFDPTLLANGRVMYTRWEHFGTMNRFPLFVTNPDGTGTFHLFGPHNRNFFHPQPTPDGRIVAIASTRVEEDAGPLALLKTEDGPADPVLDSESLHWDVLTTDVNMDGAPWPYGAFKYPFPLGDDRYVASYTLPAAEDQAVDYGLYTFTLHQTGAGTPEDPATLSIQDLTFLYNDPATNEYDAQLLAPHPKPPVIPSLVDESQDSGIFLAEDVFNRGTNDGQEIPIRGVDAIDSIAVIAARPTRVGEARDFSANDFEKRALIGFAPVQPDGSFRIRVPADTPISFATLDDRGRGFVVKRTWLYVRPGEEFTQCIGCHENRMAGGAVPTNPNPLAASLPATDLNIPPAQFQIINFEKDIAPLVETKCLSCHTPTFTQRDSTLGDGSLVTLTDTIPAPGDVDLRMDPDSSLAEMRGVFPTAYVSLSGESMTMTRQVVVPAFPRKSILIDALLGAGTRAGQAPHPGAPYALTPEEQRLVTLWVMLGAQYK
jgi:Hydrazine synthase alpha subunit middle domain/WD40-like Beta Propeller Repeat